VSETSLTSANGGLDGVPAARNERVSVADVAVVVVERVDQPENPCSGSAKPPSGSAEGSVSLNQPRLAVSDCVVGPLKVN
jgi:hypothetical protein